MSKYAIGEQRERCRRSRVWAVVAVFLAGDESFRYAVDN